MGINRRRLFAIGIGIASAVEIRNVEAQPQQSAAQPPADAALESARNQLKGEAQRVASVKLPPTTEPAAHFHA